jgi:hypothetical protein
MWSRREELIKYNVVKTKELIKYYVVKKSGAHKIVCGQEEEWSP